MGRKDEFPFERRGGVTIVAGHAPVRRSRALQPAKAGLLEHDPLEAPEIPGYGFGAFPHGRRIRLRRRPKINALPLQKGRR
jgi:hypothetical protein